ncbi:MAG: rubredoxin [Methyloprofundus sp.]|nr:rubredoxin [Methyloprofundus sp.]
MSEYRKYSCDICTHIYDEAKGDLDTGIKPGTRWKDIPDDWVCPECGATKKAFTLMKLDEPGWLDYQKNKPLS